MPHSVFTRITCCITAFLAFERCLCVAMPLKVKNFITIKRTVIVVVMIYVVMCLNVIPTCYARRYGLIYYPQKNKTLFGATLVQNGEFIESLAFPISSGITYSSFVVATICTVILIQTLYLKSKWRRRATGSTAQISYEVLSTRDKRIVKIVTLVSVAFLFSTLPSSINFTLMLYYGADYTITGRLSLSYAINWAICMFMEEINSSVSIIIYYKTSSQFRSTLKKLTRTKKTKTAQQTKET